jgi:hypothetical protein
LSCGAGIGGSSRPPIAEIDRLHRGLVCLIANSAVAVLSLAIGLGVSFTSFAAAVNSPLFMSTALAISILAVRQGQIGRLLLRGVMLSVALAVLIVIAGGVLPDSWMLAALGFWLAAFLACCRRTSKVTRTERFHEFDRTLALFIAALGVAAMTVPPRRAAVRREATASRA